MSDERWIKIGLEIHVQIGTKTKMYCRCLNNNSEDQPNSRVCPVCLGLPGSLPVLNHDVIELAQKVALGLGCKINQESRFDRKNYFYPDLPKGYQITQYFKPLATEGKVVVMCPKEDLVVRINRLHLEEDTAKMIHAGRESLLDFNRSGIPLMEIVTEPDFRMSEQTQLFLKSLRDLVRWVGASSARMQHGELRCDANISLWLGKKQLGEVVEIKNLNSIHNVKAAIDYEFIRQKTAIDNGKKIIKETRGWNAITQETVSQREKEKVHDYRYFPEPDLPVIELSAEQIIQLKNSMPVLPEELKRRMRGEYGLEEKKIEMFFENINLFYYFEKVISELMVWLQQKKVDVNKVVGSEFELGDKVAGYILTDLWPLIKSGDGLNSLKMTAENYAELIAIFYEGKINNQMMKKILEAMVKTGSGPMQIALENNWIGDQNQINLEEVIDKIILENKKQVTDYRSGKEQLLAYFIGQVMKKTNGVVNPNEARDLLVTKLKS